MNRPADSGKQSENTPVLIAKIAQKYYLERKSKQDIAQELSISRFKVARLLDQAHDLGIVKIEVALPADRDTDLERQLIKKFSLQDAVIVRDPESVEFHAAAFLGQRLRRNDVLGIGWGNSVRKTVRYLAEIDVPKPIDVVQLSGGFQEISPLANSVHIASQAAEIFEGNFYPLHVPAFVDSVATKQLIMKQIGVTETLKAMEHQTIMIHGVGSIRSADQPDSIFYRSLQRATGITPQRLRSLGAVGDIHGQVFDRDGLFIPEVADHTVAADQTVFSQIPTRIVVATGVYKAEALAVILQRALANVLVSDSRTAQEVLA